MKESKVYSTVENIFNSISLVQAFAREDEERKRFVAESQHSFDRKLSLYSLQTAYGWVVGAITAAGTAYVLYVGALHVLEGDLTTGELLIFLGYLASLYTPLNNIANTMGAIRGSLAQARRVLDVLAEDKAVPEAPDAKPLAIAKGAVSFEGVTFGYDPGRPVLTDVSFSCPGGSTVAVVGQTGAGKTSLISLLLRFYDPQKGSITIDGQDLRTVGLKSLRQQVAIVLQDTHLFPMSVHDNISYGKKNATREEVVRAAKMANADEFIIGMPEGYDTKLDERGSNLSGGQRQRLAIARALLKNAPLLILDEPTSALDAGTEALIMESLDRLMQNRTTFVIAHRLSMMRRADLILVVKDKTIREMGTFQELLDLGGEFARLHALQFAPLKERGKKTFGARRGSSVAAAVVNAVRNLVFSGQAVHGRQEQGRGSLPGFARLPGYGQATAGERHEPIRRASVTFSSDGLTARGRSNRPGRNPFRRDVAGPGPRWRGGAAFGLRRRGRRQVHHAPGRLRGACSLRQALRGSPGHHGSQAGRRTAVQGRFRGTGQCPRGQGLCPGLGHRAG